MAYLTVKMSKTASNLLIFELEEDEKEVW